MTHHPHAQQEVRQRRCGACSMGANPRKLHSLQVPSHWDPMPHDEDYRLVDILAQTEDEYWGDLEGWQVCVCHLGLCVTLRCVKDTQYMPERLLLCHMLVLCWEAAMPCANNLNAVGYHAHTA